MIERFLKTRTRTAFASGLLMLFTAALLAARSAPAPGADTLAESAQAPAPSVTAVEEALFALELPGAWSREQLDEYSWRYVAEDGHQQLLVEARIPAEPLDPDARQALLEQLLAARRTAEREAAGEAPLRLGQVSVAQQDEWLLAHFDGESGATRRFACVAMVSASSLGCFCYEALDMEADAFRERYRQVLGNVAMAEYTHSPPAD